MNELFQQIEGQEIAARLGVTSGFTQFVAALGCEPAVRSVSALIQNHPEDAALVFKRLTRLAEERIDLRYEHPSDTALSAYLMILRLADEELYKTAVDIVRGLPNIWWAAKLAEARQHSADDHTHAVSQENPGRAAEAPGFRVSSRSLESMISASVTFSGRKLIRAHRKPAAGSSANDFEAVRHAATPSTSTDATLQAA